MTSETRPRMAWGGGAAPKSLSILKCLLPLLRWRQARTWCPQRWGWQVRGLVRREQLEGEGGWCPGCTIACRLSKVSGSRLTHGQGWKDGCRAGENACNAECVCSKCARDVIHCARAACL